MQHIANCFSMESILSFPFLSIFIRTSGGISIAWNTLGGHTAVGSDELRQVFLRKGREEHERDQCSINNHIEAGRVRCWVGWGLETEARDWSRRK